MKVSYISDLHLDFHSQFHMNQIKWEKRTKEFINKLIDTDETERDVLVIAGDLSHFNQQSLWALEEFSKKYNKVLLCLGNHDYYLVSKNQERKYKNRSFFRIFELLDAAELLEGVEVLQSNKVVEYKGFRFAGLSMWYPLETDSQKMFFHNISNDSKLIKGLDIERQHFVDQSNYEALLEKEVDVMVSHFPIINIDSHFKYNSTACYLSPVKDIRVNHWIFGHSHEQKVYEKPYCNFYMNALGYPEERLEMSIKSFTI